MKNEIIKDYQKFRGLRNEWNSILSKSQANTIFLTWEWLDAWWRAYRTTERLYLIIFRKYDGTLVGIAPFVVNPINSGYFFKYKALYFLGLSMVYKESEYLDIITEKGFEEEICRRIIEILDEKHKDWDVFLYNEVPETSVCLKVIRKLIRRENWLFSETSHGCSVIKLPQTFDKYLKTLKPRMRTKLRSLPSRLRKNHKLEFEVCSGRENLLETLSSLINLHQLRWQAIGQLGIFRRSGRQQFYQFITDYFIEKKWLILFSLKVDGIYRAHEYCFLYNKKLYVLQEGYDTSWEKQGVGNVLRTFVIQYCIDHQIIKYDFLGGVTYHKNSWGVFIKRSYSVATGKRNFKTKLFIYTPVIFERLKKEYRRIVPKKLQQMRIDRLNNKKACKIHKVLSHK